LITVFLILLQPFNARLINAVTLKFGMR